MGWYTPKVRDRIGAPSVSTVVVVGIWDKPSDQDGAVQLGSLVIPRVPGSVGNLMLGLPSGVWDLPSGVVVTRAAGVAVQVAPGFDETDVNADFVPARIDRNVALMNQRISELQAAILQIDKRSPGFVAAIEAAEPDPGLVIEEIPDADPPVQMGVKTPNTLREPTTDV